MTDIACAFCDEEHDEDIIKLTASWGDTPFQWQAWGVHRSCLIERFSDTVRGVGGSIFWDRGED